MDHLPQEESQLSRMSEAPIQNIRTTTAADSPAKRDIRAAPAPPSEAKQDVQTTPAPDPDKWTAEDEAQADPFGQRVADGPYQQGRLLGKGAWGCVYKTLRVSDGEVFAGKLSISHAKLRAEAAILRSLSHERILKFVDFYEDATEQMPSMLVMEACLGGSLQDRLDHPGTIGHKQALRVMQQVAAALEYLHGQDMLHTDVKPDNILVRSWSPLDVVLADCADIKKSSQYTVVQGTRAYYSPEILETNCNSGFGDDVWALGITFLALLSQWPPLHVRGRGIEDFPRRCFNHVTTIKEMNRGHEIVEFLGKMVAWKVEERATATECVALATECLERPQQRRRRRGSGIRVPRNFQPGSFW